MGMVLKVSYIHPQCIGRFRVQGSQPRTSEAAAPKHVRLLVVRRHRRSFLGCRRGQLVVLLVQKGVKLAEEVLAKGEL